MVEESKIVLTRTSIPQAGYSELQFEVFLPRTQVSDTSLKKQGTQLVYRTYLCKELEQLITRIRNEEMSTWLNIQ